MGDRCMQDKINKQDIFDQIDLLKRYKIKYFDYKHKLDKANDDVNNVAVFGDQARDAKNDYKSQIDEGKSLLVDLKSQIQQLEDEIFSAVSIYNSQKGLVEQDKIVLKPDDLLYSSSEVFENRLYYCRFKDWFIRQEESGKTPQIECLVDKAFRLWIVQINLLDYDSDTFDVCRCSGNLIRYRGVIDWYTFCFDLNTDNFLKEQPFVKYTYPGFEKDGFKAKPVRRQILSIQVPKIAIDFGDFNYQGQFNNLLSENEHVEKLRIDAGIIYQRDISGIANRCYELKTLTLNLDIRAVVVNNITEDCPKLRIINVPEKSYLDQIIKERQMDELSGQDKVNRGYTITSADSSYLRKEIDDYVENSLETNGKRAVIVQDAEYTDKAVQTDSLKYNRFRLAYLPANRSSDITLPWFVSSFGDRKADNSIVQAFVDFWGDLVVDINNAISNTLDLQYMFYNTQNIKQVRIIVRNPSKICSMQGMFKGQQVERVEFVNVVQDNAIQMKEMFYGCYKLKHVDFGQQYFNNVTDIEKMFEGCEQLTYIDLTHFTFDKCTTASRMFYNCHSIQEIKLPYISNNHLKQVREMFSGCYRLYHIRNFDKYISEKCIDTQALFYKCRSIEKIYIDAFDMRQVRQTVCMFAECTSLKQIDMRSWTMFQLTKIDAMFYNCKNLEEVHLPFSCYLEVEQMDYLFAGCSKLQDVDFTFQFRKDSEIRLKGIFDNCTNLTSVNIRLSNLQSQQYTCEGPFIDKSSLVLDWQCELVAGFGDNIEFIDDSVDSKTVIRRNTLILKGNVKVIKE